VAYWKTLKSDDGAAFDKEVTFRCGARSVRWLLMEPTLVWNAYRRHYPPPGWNRRGRKDFIRKNR
jgi:hypothetical protein